MCFKENEKIYISSVQFSCSVVSDSLWPHESQHAMPVSPIIIVTILILTMGQKML